MGGCNNKVNDLEQSWDPSHQATKHNIIILIRWAPHIKDVARDKLHNQVPASLGTACQGKIKPYDSPCCFYARAMEKTKMISVVCSTTGSQKRHFALTMQIKQKVKNTQQSINLMFFLIGLQTFIYTNTVLLFKFTVKSDDLGIVTFSIFWFILGTIYYPHKICFNYQIWYHLFNSLRGASSPSITYSAVP